MVFDRLIEIIFLNSNQVLVLLCCENVKNIVKDDTTHLSSSFFSVSFLNFDL